MEDKKIEWALMDDVVSDIENTGATLKVLLKACNDIHSPTELYAFRSMVEAVLPKQIDILNETMKGLSENFEDVTYEPIRLD